MRMRSIYSALLFAGGLAACSSVEPPREQMGAAEAAVRQARATKAPQYAPAELRMAADKLEEAQRAMREENYHAARRFAEQALADAQLAQTKARTAEAQQMAQEMKRSIESLKGEAERGGK